MGLALFAIAFADDTAAASGLASLRGIEEDSGANLVAHGIASKDDSGGLVVADERTPGATGAVIGGVVGGIAGLVGGPAVAAMGAAAGAVSGGWFDMTRAEERRRFGERALPKFAAGRPTLLAEFATEDSGMIEARVRAAATAANGTIIDFQYVP